MDDPAHQDDFRPELELHPLLSARFSRCRSTRKLSSTTREVDALLEAARWAPSAGNSQPWAFVTAIRGSSQHEVIARRLAPSSARWAPRPAC